MRQIALALLLCASGGAIAQDLPPSASPAEAAPAAEPAPPDPLALWEADRAAALDAAGVDLAAFEYVARPFVIFADSPRDPRLEDQLRLLAADPGGLAGRDVAVIVDGDPAGRSAVRRALRPRGFDVVLLDKDGTVLLRRPAPLSAREVARAIDQTPLRREELRRPRAPE